MSFSWFDMVPGVGHEMAHVATVGVVSSIVIFISLAARASLGQGEKALMPASSISIRGFYELITDFIASLAEMVIGKEGLAYVPMFSAFFIFILINNWIGLIPGLVPATENINTTLAMGVVSFFAYNYFGVLANGPAYFKHFLGPVWWLAFIMLPIELISHAVRPLSLGLRLANVMTGDHAVLGIFLELVPVLGPVPFYLLGMFVGFVQAFVFTLLSMVYVALAIAHDH